MREQAFFRNNQNARRPLRIGAGGGLHDRNERRASTYLSRARAIRAGRSGVRAKECERGELVRDAVQQRHRPPRETARHAELFHDLLARIARADTAHAARMKLIQRRDEDRQYESRDQNSH